MAPVCGLRPLRAFLWETEKVPKPIRATRSPFRRAAVTLSMAVSIAVGACALLISRRPRSGPRDQLCSSGYFALGGLVIGHAAVGGLAIGHFVIGPMRPDPRKQSSSCPGLRAEDCKILRAERAAKIEALGRGGVRRFD